MENTRCLELDFYRTSYKSVKAHQYDIDTRFIEVTCINDAKIYPLNPESMECDLKLKTPDGRHMLKPQTIRPDGTVLITLEESMLLAAGICKAELNVYDIENKKLLSTMPFDLIVIGSVYDNKIIESSDEFDHLNNLILNNKELNDTLKQLESDITDAETKREASEASRNANEQTRKASELGRIDAEEKRVSAENARIDEEDKRKSAESTRESNEDVRIDNEEARQTAEANRTEQENVREANEDVRQSNEDVRLANEDDRNAEEKKRANAEDVRISNENAREEKESERESNESERTLAENSRADAENTRVLSENERIENETARNNAETQRISSENAREEAESIRSDEEAARNSNETQRITDEAARAKAELIRNDAETVRTLAEADREDAETMRQAAENTRVLNETKRQDNETAREAAETERGETFSELQTAVNTELEKLETANIETVSDADSFHVKVTDKDGHSSTSPNLLNSISIGNVETGDPNEDPVASITGGFGNQKLNLRLPTGKPFKINSTYSSVAAMEADIDNINLYDFIMINTGSVEDEDTGKLYMKDTSGMFYLTDLSGVQGIQGVKGDTGTTPILTIGSVTTGEPGTQASATISGTAENPVINLMIPQGNTGTIENCSGADIPYNGTNDTAMIKDVVDGKLGKNENAVSATEATQDSKGQKIDETYIKDLSVSGRVVTFTRGDDTTGTFMTQDTDSVTGVKGNTETEYRKGNINITAENIGLGKVPNVSTNDQTPTFSEATVRENIESGNKLSIILGKIAKWFADLKKVAFTGKYADLTETPTIPAAVRVKGNRNSNYRTGDVNLTPTDLGAFEDFSFEPISDGENFNNLIIPGIYVGKKNTNYFIDDLAEKYDADFILIVYGGYYNDFVVQLLIDQNGNISMRTHGRGMFGALSWTPPTFKYLPVGVKGARETAYQGGNVNLTAQNIGAVPDYNTTVIGANTDWNTITAAGSYKVQAATMDAAHNAPVGLYGYGVLYVMNSEAESTTEKRKVQIYIPHTGPNRSDRPVFVVRTQNNSWTSWARVFDKEYNDTIYVNSTGDTMSGRLTMDNTDIYITGAGKGLYVQNPDGSKQIFVGMSSDYLFQGLWDKTLSWYLYKYGNNLVTKLPRHNLAASAMYSKSGTGDNTKMWMEIIRIKVNTGYINSTICFLVGGRGWSTLPWILGIRFANSESNDPTLARFAVALGDIQKDPSSMFKIKKIATSTWSIVMALSESHGACSVLEAWNNWEAFGNNAVTITYPMTLMTTASIDSSWANPAFDGWVNRSYLADNASKLGNIAASNYIQRHVAAKLSDVDNLNQPTGFYDMNNTGLTNLAGYGAYFNLLNMGDYTGGNHRTQIAMPYQSSISAPELFIRKASATAWSGWRRALMSDVGAFNVFKIPGRLELTKSSDISSAGSPDNALLIIGSRTAEHMEFDNNEIMVKSNANTAGTLNLQINGGNLVLGGMPILQNRKLYVTDAKGNNFSVLVGLDDGDDAGNGVELLLGGGGNVFVGSGESAYTLRNALIAGVNTGEAYAKTGENVYISSDGNIYFYTNCNTISARNGLFFGPDLETFNYYLQPLFSDKEVYLGSYDRFFAEVSSKDYILHNIYNSKHYTGEVYFTNWGDFQLTLSDYRRLLFETNGYDYETRNWADVLIHAMNSVKIMDTVNVSTYRAIHASKFNVSSSFRYKENIEDITKEEADKILDIRIISFDYKEEYGGQKGNFGVGAEEAVNVIPSVVTFEGEKPDSVDYSKFVPHLIKKVQMQQEEIDNLKAQNQQLEERLVRIEALLLTH